MTADRDRFVWYPDQMTVTRPCQACGEPAGDDVIRGLCTTCAATIDRDTEARLEAEHFGELEAGP